MVFRIRRQRDARETAERVANLSTEELRQADDDRESIRVLDGSLALALLAFAVIGIYVAAVLAT